MKVPGLFSGLRARLWIDEIYDASVLRFVRFVAASAGRLENGIIASISSATAYVALGAGWLSRFFDYLFIDSGFDRTCRALSETAGAGKKMQNGQIQNYLRTIALTLAILVLLLVWGCKQV